MARHACSGPSRLPARPAITQSDRRNVLRYGVVRIIHFFLGTPVEINKRTDMTLCLTSFVCSCGTCFIGPLLLTFLAFFLARPPHARRTCRAMTIKKVAMNEILETISEWKFRPLYIFIQICWSGKNGADSACRRRPRWRVNDKFTATRDGATIEN